MYGRLIPKIKKIKIKIMIVGVLQASTFLRQKGMA
jgi:hypothetical protein